jgi:hypothetical protein
MGRRLSCEQFLGARDVGADDRVEGEDLGRLFWTLKQRQIDAERNERYWASMREALTLAYEELERKSTEVGRLQQELVTANEALNIQLQARVRERSRELGAALRRAGRSHETAFLAPGTVVGRRARIVRKLGEGGMGSVYAATDLLTNQPVAIKIFSSADPRALHYFVAEAEAAAVVCHPAVVRTLHVDVTDEGFVFQLMDLVDGVTLARRLRSGHLVPAAVARVGAVVAGALAAAHARGVVHRDVKPDNILLCAEPPGVRVLDFGVARRLFAEPETQFAAVVGTPPYMAPDQIRAPAGVTSAADVYSLGVVLFEAACGRRPFAAAQTEALLLAHLNEPPPRLGAVAPGVPPALAAHVEACLEKDPANRPAAAELERALERVAGELGAPPGEQLGREACADVAATERTLLEG